MEVICSSCGTEYDFDEARVPTDGVTVKCTTCGHIFKVTKQGAVANVNTSAASKKKGANWQIKKQNGDHLSFKALSTLQKWIVERKVSAEDEISRTGDKWTKLADVPEFSGIFKHWSLHRHREMKPLQRKPYQPTELKKHQTRKYKTAVKKRKWRPKPPKRHQSLTKNQPLISKRNPWCRQRGTVKKKKKKQYEKEKHKEKHHA